MKKIKIYNVIFPIWFLMFFPPVIVVTLAGNFIIDSIVALTCYFVFRLSKIINLKMLYRKSILKVWLFGFLADIIGALILFLFGMFGDYVGLPYELISGINYDPFSHPAALIVIICSMLISGAFIFLFNYRFTFSKLIQDKSLRLKTALTIAIVTIPWTFLLPTKWFYSGF